MRMNPAELQTAAHYAVERVLSLMNDARTAMDAAYPVGATITAKRTTACKTVEYRVITPPHASPPWWRGHGGIWCEAVDGPPQPPFQVDTAKCMRHWHTFKVTSLPPAPPVVIPGAVHDSATMEQMEGRLRRCNCPSTGASMECPVHGINGTVMPHKCTCPESFRVAGSYVHGCPIHDPEKAF